MPRGYGGVPFPEPLAFFLTCTTYGTWLPGDKRGWVRRGQGHQPPDPSVELDALARMGEGACRLDEQERRLVTATIENHCARRGWVTHAINCRSNHVHVVLTAAARPAEVRRQLKAWTSRALGAHERERAVGRDVAPKPFRRRWWSERGSTRYLNDEAGLEAAILYVRDGQKTRRR